MQPKVGAKGESVSSKSTKDGGREIEVHDGRVVYVGPGGQMDCGPLHIGVSEEVWTTRTQAIEIAKALLGAHGVELRERREWSIDPEEGKQRRLVSDPIEEPDV